MSFPEGKVEALLAFVDAIGGLKIDQVLGWKDAGHTLTYDAIALLKIYQMCIKVNV